jgi:hypothetical protein
MNNNEYNEFLRECKAKFEAMKMDVLIWSPVMKPHYIKEIAIIHNISKASVRSCYITIRATHGFTVRPKSEAREAILKRDNYTCQYCGIDDVGLVDHVISAWNGGPGMPWNLVAVCTSCNNIKKSDTWLPNNIKKLAKLNKDWAKHIKKEAVGLI